MEIILKQDVKNLGEKDTLVKVKNGYGLNFLIPKGLAILATTSSKKMHEENIRQRGYKEGMRKVELGKVADNLKNLSIKISAKVGENGKIFGSVTTIQVAEALKNLGHDIDRKLITLEEEHIKAVGTYSADLKLHKDIIVKVNFDVVAEE